MKTLEFKSSLYILLFAMTFFVISCNKDSKEPEGNLKTENTSEDNKSGSANKESVKSELQGDNFEIDYSLVGVISGNMSILRSGNLLKQIVNTEVVGVQSSNTVYIIDGIVYSISQAAGKTIGQKTNLSEYKKGAQTGETIVDPKEFEKFLEGKSVIGTENILGYQCDIYKTGPEMSISVYDSKYVLRILIPQFQAVAVKLNLDATFASNEFTVPDNIDFNTDYSKKTSKEEIEKMLKNLKK